MHHFRTRLGFRYPTMGRETSGSSPEYPHGLQGKIVKNFQITTHAGIDSPRGMFCFQNSEP